jgi:hypothetical protein
MMKMYGSLNKISSIRLEAKHKPHKEYAKIFFCRKNLPWSLAVKEQLNLSQRFFSENAINWNLPEFGPVLNSELLSSRGIAIGTKGSEGPDVLQMDYRQWNQIRS